MSAELCWSVVRKNSCFLVKSQGLTLTKEPNNLTGLNSYKYNGLVNKKKITSMKRFCRDLEKTMAVKLSKQEKKDLKQLFESFDQDLSGTISIDELEEVIKCLNIEIRSGDMKKLFDAVDKDGSGSIEFDEFVEVFTATFCPPSQAELVASFRALDQNGDGLLCYKEIKQAMKNAGQPMSDRCIKEMIEFADKNGDGLVNYEEFVSILKA